MIKFNNNLNTMLFFIVHLNPNPKGKERKFKIKGHDFTTNPIHKEPDVCEPVRLGPHNWTYIIIF
jgi:hypothetical protein